MARQYPGNDSEKGWFQLLAECSQQFSAHKSVHSQRIYKRL